MSEQQLSKLVAALVEHQSAFGSLSTNDRQWVIQHTKGAIAIFAEAVKNRASDIKTSAVKLLEFVRTVSLVAVGKFVATEKFRPGETVDGVKIGGLGDNFKATFLGKIELPTPALDIREHKLLKGSRGPAIITELGGEKKVEISLSQFWEFLKTADHNFWYVAYIRDTSHVPWAVNALWYDGELHVGAASFDYPNLRYAVYRFLSR